MEKLIEQNGSDGKEYRSDSGKYEIFLIDGVCWVLSESGVIIDMSYDIIDLTKPYGLQIE